MFRLFSGGGPGSGSASHNRPSSSSSSSSSYAVVSKGSEGHDAIPRALGLAPNLSTSATFNEKAVSTADIPTLAEAATISLDQAGRQIESHRQRLGAPAAVDAHVKTLAEVRSSVQQVMIQEDLQTPPVQGALNKLLAFLDALVACTSAAAFSLSDLDKVMDQVLNAGQNLENRLPGDMIVAIENNADGIQINAALGAVANRRRLNIRAVRNKAGADAVQVNAPVFEGATDLFAAILNARPARAV